MYMTGKYIITMTIALAINVATGHGLQNLIENGNFDAPGDPLQGWLVDYEWAGNRHYIGNINNVSVVPQEAGRSDVLRLQSNVNAGTKVESSIIPFSMGQSYRATLYIKGGRPYRVQFRGYQWKPGIRPHDNPQPEELREVYRSKAVTGEDDPWHRITLEIPGTEPTDLSLQHLRRVRFIRLFIWCRYRAFVDNVSVVRTR